MGNQDIRWQQRFVNFKKALAKLAEVVNAIDTDWEDGKIGKQFSELEKEGVIQRFEYTHELAWNVMKDYSEYQGNTEIGGSRDATREAFKIGLITNGEKWMDMIKSRNQTSHTYNEATAFEIFMEIVRSYYPLFIAFQSVMEDLRNKSREDLFSKEL